MKKLVFLDIDGTLVDYQNRLPASAAEAVREARAQGTRVYLCTGRLLAEIPEEIRNLADGLIGGNGTYITDGGEVLLDRSFSGEEERRIVDWLQQHGLEFYLETNAGLFSSPGFAEAAAPLVRAYRGDDDVSVEEAFHGLRPAGELYRDDVKKISYVLRHQGEQELARKAFPDLVHGNWGGPGDKPLFGDMGVAGLDKGEAAKSIIARYGGSEVQTYAFGDAGPDIPLFRVCDVSVAMGGGGQETKSAASMVAETVEEDGLARAFGRLGLIGSGKEKTWR